jgi:hypothetical protein
LEVENQTKWWKRNSDASNVVGEYYIIDKNGVQSGAVTNQSIATYLVAGAKVVKDMEGYHSILPDANPHSIIFRATCNEHIGVNKKSLTRRELALGKVARTLRFIWTGCSEEQKTRRF